MKSNNKIANMKERILKAVNSVYKHGDESTLPDVKQICELAQIDRQTALKFLHQWWQENPKIRHKIEPNFPFSYQELKQVDELGKPPVLPLNIFSNELKLYHFMFNLSVEKSLPFATLLVDSLYQALNKWIGAIKSIKQLKIEKEILEAQTKTLRQQCDLLDTELKEMRSLYAHMLETLSNQLAEPNIAMRRLAIN